MNQNNEPIAIKIMKENSLKDINKTAHKLKVIYSKVFEELSKE
jgi:hypothetical protein